ncbi:amidohydrolase [Permianibacter sp. IMCC34836]|nr:amidohydrolase [Permianibacter fluminis]
MPTFAADFSLTASTENQCKAVEPKVIGWRREIHQNPELGNREFKTSAKVAAHLKKLGIKVQTGVAHTGVVGILEGGKPGPVIAIRADMDGLPITERTGVPFASKVKGEYNGAEVGVMHACGHDTHVAILMGVAEVLAGQRKDLSGTVKFIFQPAEEGTPKGEEGGAELMVKEGVLDNPKVDAIFALHIDASLDAGKIGWKSGPIAAAVDDLRIVVKGKGSHGAYPWAGIDPIVTSAQIINGLQTVVSRSVELTDNAAVVTIGKIQGGVRSNIIPEQVEMLGTVRTLSDDARTLVHQRIHTIAENIAESMGATVEVNLPYSSHYPVNKNDAALVARMLPVLKAIAGEANLSEQKAQTGAEDHSFFADKVPSFYISLGGKIPGKDPKTVADHHTADFYVDESGLILGVRALTAMTLASLQQPAN